MSWKMLMNSPTNTAEIVNTIKICLKDKFYQFAMKNYNQEVVNIKFRKISKYFLFCFLNFIYISSFLTKIRKPKFRGDLFCFAKLWNLSKTSFHETIFTKKDWVCLIYVVVWLPSCSGCCCCCCCCCRSCSVGQQINLSLWGPQILLWTSVIILSLFSLKKNYIYYR